MRRLWLLPPLAVLMGGLGYCAWVVNRTEGTYTRLSQERVRYAHLSDVERLQMTCLGAHGRLDASKGHPSDFCLPFLKEKGLLPSATRSSHEPFETHTSRTSY